MFSSFLPAIISIREPSVTSETAFRQIRLPSRSTVTVSQISRISSSLWEMKMIATPFARSFRIIRRSSSISCAASAEVGSSIMMMRES